MLKIGDIELYLIDDMTNKVDPGGAFGLVPRVLWSRYMTPDDDQLIRMQQVNLLIKTGGKNIIVDTGYGDKLDEKRLAQLQPQRPPGGLVRGLARLGLAAGDIDLVIDTHLHSDHCGGNTSSDDAGNLRPTFPNAEYVVQRREYEDAMQPNERTRATYQPENYQPLVASGQMRLLDGDSELAAGVYGVVTPGHTLGHMSVRIERNGQHAFFACDLATYAVHFERLAWMTAYDVQPLVTLETKRKWQSWALATGATLIFTHDPTRTVGKLTQDERGRYKVETLETEVIAV
jgi:glyoxylase-like metal-dependent hydrolase (beta-lactamase superfamily II)